MRVEVVRGWTPASPVYTVTRAEGNVLHEIEGEAATDWYRRFFTIDGELAPMPAAANRFPLIVEGPGDERQGLYRSMRSFDDPPGAVTFWGSVRTGDRVRLGMGNDVSLVRTASALGASPEAPEAAILYSCVGREIVLGEGAPDEAAAIHRSPRRRGALRLLHLRRDRPDPGRQPRLLQPDRHPGPALRGGLLNGAELDNAILRNLLAQTTRAYEQQMAELFAEKELAQVTLASIGDGVLATDAEGRVKYMNPWPRS